MMAPADRTMRSRQAIGLVVIALAILLFAAFRAGWHAIFVAGWWRLW